MYKYHSCSSICYIRGTDSEQVWLPRLDSVGSLRACCLGVSKELVMPAVMAMLTTIWCSLSSSTVMETAFTCFYTISISRSGRAFLWHILRHWVFGSRRFDTSTHCITENLILSPGGNQIAVNKYNIVPHAHLYENL